MTVRKLTPYLLIDLLVCAFFIKTRGLRGRIGWLFSVFHLYDQAKVFFPLEENHGMRFFSYFIFIFKGERVTSPYIP